MNRILLAVLAVLALSSAMAESSLYLGARGFAPLNPQAFSLTNLSIGGQLGANFEMFGLRGLVQTNLGFSSLRVGGDAYLNLGSNLSKIYLGGGGSVGLAGGLDPEAHGLAGLETKLGGMGLFVEALPGFGFGGVQPVFDLKLSAGLNIHF